jgi:hypothetical protein
MSEVDEAWPVGAALKNPVTIKNAPTWMRNGDVIERRGKKYYVISLHEPETRWEKLVRKLRRWIERH